MNANEIFDLLFTNTESIANNLGFTVTCPKITIYRKQSLRNNYP